MLNKPATNLNEDVLRVNVEGRTFSLSDGGELHAVGKLSLSLSPRSFTCIVGPSGCGKTTTLRMILGLDHEFEGNIGHGAGHSVSAVFQEPRLLPWRTVEQNIRLVLPPERLNEPLDALFDVLELNDVLTFFPNQLSLGLARRASLARAFVLNPKLLVLDEPFVSLDDDTADRLRSLLLTLWVEKQVAALMVTHNLREAALLADRILVLSKRPTHILGEVIVDTARENRDASYINSIVERIQAISFGK